MTNIEDIKIPWVRIWGPEKASLCSTGVGDDAAGDYAWVALYGCGTQRAEIVTYLAVSDMNEEWSDENPAWVSQMICTYTIAGTDDYDAEVANEDHDYDYDRDLGIVGNGPSDTWADGTSRAYASLDAWGRDNVAWQLAPLTFDEAQAGTDDPSDWAVRDLTMEQRHLLTCTGAIDLEARS